MRAVFSNFVHRLDFFFPELGKLVKEHVFSILFKTQHREKTATWQCHRKDADELYPNQAFSAWLMKMLVLAGKG